MAYISWLFVVLYMLAAGAAAWHALLFKRDSRAALGWIVTCVLFPLVGPLLYYLLGVNRVENRARVLGGKKPRRRFVDFERGRDLSLPEQQLDGTSTEVGLKQASMVITGQSLLKGNDVDALFNGDGAYPVMLAAIDRARQFIYLTTYIFDTDTTGRLFIEGLGNAVARGVEVKVMIDGLGEKYTWPRAARLLKRAGVEVCLYNPPRLLPPTLSINLRNHRKILVVDNMVGFTGGMNISGRHLVEKPVVKRPVADIHFAVKGPLVDQLRAIFANSWSQATGCELQELESTTGEIGGSFCRAIVDGPDENLDRLALVLQAAVTSARQSVRIMTPYFLPSSALVGCLQSAALRGVAIQILVPEKSNLRFVDWATRNMLWELLFYDIKVFYQPQPFDHTKLLMIDEDYLLIGSANIDPRSLRLNYELGVEIYDRQFCAHLTGHFNKLTGLSRPVTLQEVDGRSLAKRTRDAICWLFSPYL